ncbi:unnamed protein product [Rangifer tarandus platyrhynchus]|uniref:Uncharacterized protein n=1 Tax=Rangifer tarandus platyrhynchus TaxID=3082113 RepID=A0ABN9A899_RANTA|nr:unnamed protein product [Rangifer tarandus platyrhynchus]
MFPNLTLALTFVSPLPMDRHSRCCLDLSINSIPGLSITVLHMSIANCRIFWNLLIIWVITCCYSLYFLGIMYSEELDFLLVLETEREKKKNRLSVRSTSV